MIEKFGIGLRKIAFAGFLLISFTGGVHAAEFTMKMGTATVNDVQTYAMKQFAQRVEAASGGRIKTELYPAAQLGSNARMIEGLQFGTLQFYTGPAAYLVGVDPGFQVADAPGLFRDASHAQKVSSDPEFRDAFLTLGEDAGLIALGAYPYGETSFATEFPAKTPETLRGKKIRVMASDLERETISVLGATAAPIDFSEVTTALEQGTIDGIKTGAKVFTSLQLYDVIDYLTITEGSIITNLLVVSKRWFDDLPTDLQQILQEEARELEPELWKFALEDQERAYSEWQEQGGTVYRWTPEQNEDVAKRMRETSVEFLRKNEETAQILDVILKTAEKY